MTNQENPYETPLSELTEKTQDELVLASRWERLGAAIVDTILAFVMVIPFMYLGFASVDEPQYASQYEWLFDESLTGAVVTTAYTFVAFLLLHGVLLARYGQTIGKKIVGIKVVDFKTGQLLSFNRIVGLRYLPLWIAQSIPIGGGILWLINALFIFAADKRCIHDHIAGTKVVNA